MKHVNPFYVSSAWRRLRREVLADDRYECQDCMRRGIYTKANTVHHVKHYNEYPELGLSREYVDGRGKRHRNLVSLCRACHDAHHEFQAGELAREAKRKRAEERNAAKGIPERW